MSKKHFEKFAIAIGGIMDTTERKRMANLIGEVCAKLVDQGFQVSTPR